MKESNIVSLRDISVDFDGEPILVGLDLDIRDKEFVVERPQPSGRSVDLSIPSRVTFFLTDFGSTTCRRINGMSIQCSNAMRCFRI